MSGLVVHVSLLLALVAAACGSAATPTATSAPPAYALAANPTRPPSCPPNYPDPQPYPESAYVGPGTVVAVVDSSQLRVTVDVPTGHPFSGQTLLLKVHSSAKLLPGSTRDLIAFGLKAGDRVQLDVWHFLAADCSYSVTKIEKLSS